MRFVTVICLVLIAAPAAVAAPLTADQLLAIQTGEEFALEYAERYRTTPDPAGAVWPEDRCPTVMRELGPVFSGTAGYALFQTCNYVVSAGYADSPTRICEIATHERSHLIRGDAWHPDLAGHPLDVRARPFPPCRERFAVTYGEALRLLRAQLSHPWRWRIDGAGWNGRAYLRAVKRRTGTVRYWVVSRRPSDGVILVVPDVGS